MRYLDCASCSCASRCRMFQTLFTPLFRTLPKFPCQHGSRKGCVRDHYHCIRNLLRYTIRASSGFREKPSLTKGEISYEW
jgi:hypothetical protein